MVRNLVLQKHRQLLREMRRRCSQQRPIQPVGLSRKHTKDADRFARRGERIHAGKREGRLQSHGIVPVTRKNLAKPGYTGFTSELLKQPNGIDPA